MKNNGSDIQIGFRLNNSSHTTYYKELAHYEEMKIDLRNQYLKETNYFITIPHNRFIIICFKLH